MLTFTRRAGCAAQISAVTRRPEAVWRSEGDFTAPAETFYQLIQRILTEFPNIKAAGIGLPGVIVKGTVATCDISVFAGVPVEQQMRERFGIYVQADNDMNYTAYGFYRSSCMDVTAPVAYIFKPEVPCLGCGMVINGQVLQGASQFAGDVSSAVY